MTTSDIFLTFVGFGVLSSFLVTYVTSHEYVLLLFDVLYSSSVVLQDMCRYILFSLFCFSFVGHTKVNIFDRFVLFD